jgi:heme-degrading monooxygenase HmoA
MSIVKINAITVPRERFEAWLKSADFAAGHSQHRERGPVGTDTATWGAIQRGSLP